MAIQNVSVLGAGTMGAGIAQTAITAGFDTVLYDIGEEVLEKARSQISRRLDRQVEKGRMDGLAAAAAMNRLRTETVLEDAVATAD